MKSLTSQLAYTYSANRKAGQPFEHLLFTALSGRTQARLESMSNAAYKRWVDAEFWLEGYERLWIQSGIANVSRVEESPRPSEGHTGGVAEASASLGAYLGDDDTSHQHGDTTKEDPEQQQAHNPSHSRRPKPPSSAPKDSVIYLTADSQDELMELEEGKTYIIGGIVDHNRYKVRPTFPLYNRLTIL